MTHRSPSPDPSFALGTSLAAVAVTGAAITVLSAVLEIGATRGVFIGAVIATLNLWVLSRVVRALFRPGLARIPWSLAAIVKFGALALGLYLLVDRGVADVLSLILGYAALPIGIVLREASASRVKLGETGNA